MSKYLVAGRAFRTKGEITAHFRSVRDNTPLHGEIHDPVVRWFLVRHPQWEQKSRGMTAIGTALIKGSPAAPPRKEIAILRGPESPMDISWTKLVRRLQTDGTLAHPSEPEEALAELRIAARQETEDQRALLSRPGFHVDHAYPATFEQLLFDWFTGTGLALTDLTVKSNDGPVVLRWFENRSLASSWQEYHKKNAILVLRTPEEHAAQPQLRIDWSAYLEP